MLILRRRPGESIVIGGEIVIKVLEVSGNQIKLGIEAPAHIPVHRLEVLERIRQENLSAARVPSDLENFLLKLKK
ncbi:carbon storage regulator CsrA [Thermodesulfatator autotrophicus]|uniref:Translational regulator CsrA n=1 Tax=Thermodesulfatator autotrophicus TaxID=1795632 RepID=A0A177E9F2_9BACT|nr:carbon storage regulator CsrA [Thermodesulfatator autotrophicus]OAG28583.1 carbon storage regulator [Thermodesulfatator autotrophicus]